MKVNKHRKTHKEIWDQAYQAGHRDGKFEEEHRDKPKKDFDFERAKILNQLVSNVGQTIQVVNELYKTL